MTNAKHYYECHITIEPVFGDQLQVVKAIAEYAHFKVAHLLMKKRDEDTEVRSKHDTFMTSHHKEYFILEERMKRLIFVLKETGFKVWRYKIEDILLDSRIKDELELLV